MKGHSAWSFAPYQPLLFDTGDIYVCRVAPGARELTFQWLPVEGEAEYEIFFSAIKEPLLSVGRTRECSFCLQNLDTDTDYQFQVVCGEKRSRIRLARTGDCPGTVVNYLHPEDECYSFSGRYLCSPSMIRHPDGYLLAAMDVYASHAPQNLSMIFRSDDDGKNWRYVTELYPCFWPKLFLHRGKVYVLACSTEYGDLLIGCSEDGGESFGAPTVLFRGSCKCEKPGIHKNPQPVVEFGGRLWNTLEWGCWHDGTHAPMVMSASTEDDLLLAESWHFTPPVPYDPSWPGTAEGPSAGNIEGTLVCAPDQKLYNIMRYDMRRCTPNYGRVLAYEVDTQNVDAPLRYSHAIDFPGNHAKFEIQYDEQSGCYLSIVSRILNAECSGHRNLLSLLYSRDLKEWQVALDLLDRRDEDPELTGFQYVDFMMEGNDLLYLCRTALNQPHNYHDSNYSTFHRLSDFRTYLKAK